MRLILFSAIICSIAMVTDSRAMPRRTVRVAQLISADNFEAPRTLEAEISKSDSANEAIDVDDTDQREGGKSAASFQLHDLSRRWRRSQEVSGLAKAEPRLAISAATMALPEPVSAISVPDWMRSQRPFPLAGRGDFFNCDGRGYRPAGFLGAEAEFRRAAYYDAMRDIACQYGIPVNLFDALIIRESGYNPAASSPRNAFGLTQLMPATAEKLAINRYDIAQNLQGGARYLRAQLERFEQVQLALAAYNAGPGRIHGGRVPEIPQTQAYVAEILRIWRRLSGLADISAEKPSGPAMVAVKERAHHTVLVTSF